MNLRLAAAEHAFHTTPDELLELNLGRLVAALNDRLITPDYDQALTVRTVADTDSWRTPR